MPDDRTLGDELARAARRFADLPAFHFHGRAITFADWDREAMRFARALLHAGLGHGSRIALLLPPVPDYMFCYLGAARVGALTTGISTRYRRREIRQILENLEPHCIVTIERQGKTSFVELIDEAQRLLPRRARVVRFEGGGTDSLERFLAAGDRSDAALDTATRRVTARDPVALIYTSGTTGPPKGALYDAAAMTALTRIFLERSLAPRRPGTPNLWPGMSLSHVGAMARVHIQLATGSTLVLHDRFDEDWLLEQILRFRPARLGGFPAVLMRLIRRPDLARHDLSFVRAVTFGGAPLAPHLAEEIRERLGVEVYTGYSCTETCVISATQPGDPPEKLRATVGRPSAGVEVTIVDEERRPRPAGEPGRVAVLSPATMRGYWRNPRATERALDERGRLYTEDIGVLDADGYLRLLGREKEMYYRSGFNVYPGEIEEVLQSHPEVVQAAVLGAPDDVLGEKGWAFVVPRDTTHPPSLAELRGHVGRELASYKRPDELRIVDELPLNAMLKVDKRRLREQLTARSR